MTIALQCAKCSDLRGGRTCLRQFDTTLSAYIVLLQRKWSREPAGHPAHLGSPAGFLHTQLPHLHTCTCELCVHTHLYLLKFKHLLFHVSSMILPAIPAHLFTLPFQCLQFSLLLTVCPHITSGLLPSLCREAISHCWYSESWKVRPLFPASPLKIYWFSHFPRVRFNLVNVNLYKYWRDVDF